MTLLQWELMPLCVGGGRVLLDEMAVLVMRISVEVREPFESVKIVKPTEGEIDECSSGGCEHSRCTQRHRSV
jgi:hypothetical protein